MASRLISPLYRQQGKTDLAGHPMVSLKQILGPNRAGVTFRCR